MKLFNHKLYNKYYPIQTYMDAQKFVDDYGFQNILRALRCESEELLQNSAILHLSYEENVRNEHGLFQSIKDKNKSYNSELKLKFQNELHKLSHQIDKNAEMQQDIVNEKVVSISIANHILEYLNHHHRYVWSCIMILGVLVINTLVCVIMYICKEVFML